MHFLRWEIIQTREFIQKQNKSKILVKYQNSKMSSYKEKYHLKKTEPLKNKPKTGIEKSFKNATKNEKVSTLTNDFFKRKTQKDRHHYRKHIHLPQNQQSKQQVKNSHDVSQVTIYKRSQSMNNMKKNKLQAAKSLEYWKKQSLDINLNIISSVQNFFQRILNPDNGCICEEPCQIAAKLFRWVDIPEYLVAQHYQKLREKVHSKKLRQPHNFFEENLQKEEQTHLKQRQKNFKQIKKDIERTHSQSLTFHNPVFKRRLDNILKCYVIQDHRVGYVQGMNMILAGILYHVKDEAKTYGVFRKLLYSVRSIYLENFRQCYIHVNRIGHLIQQNLPEVQAVIQQHNVDLSMICLPWIISLLSSIVPLEYIHLIFIGFIKQRWSFIYKVSLSIFVYFKEQIIQTTEESQLLTLLSASQESMKQIDWQDIVKYAQKLQISLFQN